MFAFVKTLRWDSVMDDAEKFAEGALGGRGRRGGLLRAARRP